MRLQNETDSYIVKKKLSDKFKQIVKEEFKNITGTVKLEISQGGICDVYLNIKLN